MIPAAMTLYAEQLRALDYLQRKGTEAPAERIRQQAAESLGKFEAATVAVPAALRQASPGPGRWSVHEIIDHLVESHRPAIDQLRSLLEGRTPETGAIPANLQSADPLSRSWNELVAELEGIHRSILNLTESATDAHSLDVRAPIAMVVKVQHPDGSVEPVEWEERLDWKAFVQTLRVHTLQHLAQIERTLAEVSAAG
jgi:hypothetical protein